MKNFDVEVPGAESPCRSIEALMAEYRCLAKERHWEDARDMLVYCCQSGYLPAKLELARFYMDAPRLEMSYPDRYFQAERLLLQLWNLDGLSREMTLLVCRELTRLYGFLNRPIACLAVMLRARRHGETALKEGQLQQCRKRLSQLDVNSLKQDDWGCYALGVELSLAGTFRTAELFLREAASSENEELSGRSYLALAELYDELSLSEPACHREAEECYRLAFQRGSADILTRKGHNGRRLVPAPNAA